MGNNQMQHTTWGYISNIKQGRLGKWQQVLHCTKQYSVRSTLHQYELLTYLLYLVHTTQVGKARHTPCMGIVGRHHIYMQLKQKEILAMNHATVLSLAEKHRESLLAAFLIKEKPKLPPYLQPAKPLHYWEQLTKDIEHDIFYRF